LRHLCAMETIYDYVTMAIFAGLIVLFLERSMGSVADRHPIWSYLLPSLGCAIANTLGNRGHDVPAVLMLLATLAYVALVLKPLAGWRRN
jgi:hypothetical protein